MPESLGTSGLLLGSMIAMFASLLALFWPIIRGVPFARFRQETGLFARNILVEGFAGLATYTLMLPIVIVGVVLSLLLGLIISFFFGELPPPEHPIQGAIGGSLLGLVLIYLVACVAAPIVEEIMFRGVLYRYLRDGTGRLGWVLSFLTSALVSSFIFAAIHPQGVTFIPILGSLAVAFCIGREWRGSLVAPMVAHALNNGVVMTLNVMLLA
jgi:membrane protease YdiL (CAAX protease family)